MSFVYLLKQFAVFGILGQLIEVWFTGIKSMLTGRLEGTAKTYLAMVWVYGTGGTILALLSGVINWYAPLKALLFTVIIFAVEFGYGLLFQKLLGRCPWKYTSTETGEQIHRFSIMGLIRVDYFPYWYILALVLTVYLPKMQSVVDVISKM